MNLSSGRVTDFVVNQSMKPASVSGGAGLERPIQLEWDADGVLYLLDFGVIEVTPTGMKARPDTGKIWKSHGRELKSPVDFGCRRRCTLADPRTEWRPP